MTPVTASSADSLLGRLLATAVPGWRERSRESPAPTQPAGDAGAPLDWNTLDALGRPTDTKSPQVRRQASTQMISELFFKPLLAEMREFPLGKDLATGGFGESAFAPQLDERLADHIANSMTSLVDQVAAYFEPPGTKSAPNQREWTA
jgi:hypothetical protein